MRVLIAVAVFSSLAIFHHSTRAYGESTAVLTRTPDTQLQMQASGRANKVAIDGVDANTMTYRSLDLKMSSDFDKLGGGLGIQRLDRYNKDQRAQLELQKNTSSIEPSLIFRASKGLELSAAHRIYSTQAENSLNGKNEYYLNTSRTTLGLALIRNEQKIKLNLGTEARAEHEYSLGNGYPMVDRDYIPLQVDLAYERQINHKLKAEGRIRYSHYNADVYEDQYDSAAPKTPTLGQVFDYLLSFAAGAQYQLNDILSFVGQLNRKAALDTNSYAGDEYTVAYGAYVGVDADITGNASAGLGVSTSTGAKTHKVQGQSYDYANRLNSVQGTIAVKL